MGAARETKQAHRYLLWHLYQNAARQYARLNDSKGLVVYAGPQQDLLTADMFLM